MAVFYTSLGFSMEETLTQKNSFPPSFKIQSGESVLTSETLQAFQSKSPRRESDDSVSTTEELSIEKLSNRHLPRKNRFPKLETLQIFTKEHSVLKKLETIQNQSNNHSENHFKNGEGKNFADKEPSLLNFFISFHCQESFPLLEVDSFQKLPTILETIKGQKLLWFDIDQTLIERDGNLMEPCIPEIIQGFVKDDTLVGCNTRRESDWMSILGSCYQLEKNNLNLKETLPQVPIEKESFFSSLHQLFIASFKEPSEDIIKKFLREDNPGYTYAPVFSKGTLWLDGVPGGKGDAIISVLYEAWQNIKEDSIIPVLSPSKIYGSSFDSFYQALQKADLTILLVDDTARELKAFKESLEHLSLKVISLLYKGK